MAQMMIIKKREELKRIRSQIPAHRSIGLVPTMGNLHQGHLSLLKESLNNHDVTFLSIFVNPKQFGPQEDFAKYPRTLDQDLTLINSLLEKKDEKEVYIFAPDSPQEIYPTGFDTTISVGALTRPLCGQVRPGHFAGVTTVVYLLFTLVKPQVSYFGLKDYQQFTVIRKMVEDLELPLEARGLPIIRDESGLALSSRNQYLTPAEKKDALILIKTLQHLQQILETHPFAEALSLATTARAEILKDPAWDYLEILDAKTLTEAKASGQEVVIAGAYKIRGTRLLDNLTTRFN